MNKAIPCLLILNNIILVFCCIYIGTDLISSPQPVTETSTVAGVYKVTAYCPGSCCCGKYADGITASGKPAVGLVVAAPPNIPFGTVLDIPGYGKAEVLDRGGAIKNNRLDVLFTDKDGVSGHQRALNWGVKYLEVKEICNENSGNR